MEALNHNDEVIALRVDNYVYFGQLAVGTVLKAGRCDQIYTRGVFYLMAELDLDPRWKEWAVNAPTLFLKSEVEVFGAQLDAK